MNELLTNQILRKIEDTLDDYYNYKGIRVNNLLITEEIYLLLNTQTVPLFSNCKSYIEYIENNKGIKLIVVPDLYGIEYIKVPLYDNR